MEKIILTIPPRNFYLVFKRNYPARMLRALGLLLADDGAPQWGGGRLFGTSTGFLGLRGPLVDRTLETIFRLSVPELQLFP